MYNLMVTASDNAWEEGDFIWSNGRILEYTDEALTARFVTLSEENLTEMASFPTLFMYEQGTEGPIRVGYITHVQKRGNETRIIFEFDNSIPPLSPQIVQDLKWDLQIQDFEFSRTHWAVKNVDLYTALAEVGVRPNPVQEAESPRPVC